MSENSKLQSVNIDKNFDDDEELQKQLLNKNNIILTKKNKNITSKSINNSKLVSEDPFQEELQKTIKKVRQIQMQSLIITF